MFDCLLTGGVDVFFWEAQVLLMCLLEIPPRVCWEELAQSSTAAF